MHGNIYSTYTQNPLANLYRNKSLSNSYPQMGSLCIFFLYACAPFGDTFWPEPLDCVACLDFYRHASYTAFCP